MKCLKEGSEVVSVCIILIFKYIFVFVEVIVQEFIDGLQKFNIIKDDMYDSDKWKCQYDIGNVLNGIVNK